MLHQEGIFTFSYETSGYRRKLAEEMDNGYRPHLAFPDTNRVYTSNRLFGPFARRLPDPRRPDYQTVLQDLGLPLDCTEMDALRASGGILATDSYEFVSPVFVEGNHFDLDFFVAGWRYYDGESVHPQTVPHRKVNISIVGELNHLIDIAEISNDKEQLRLVMC